MSIHHVSGDTALTILPDDPVDPVGVSQERVDSYTLTVVHQLFPSPTCGVGFLALLLRLARAKQLSLEMEGHDVQLASVAVISVQSIRQLSALIGWSHESTHKYVVLFCALGLLIKRRNRGLVELHFPLNRYTPPTLDALDKLIGRYRNPQRKGKTDKRLKHAERVKQRFLLLYGTPTSAALPPAPESAETITAAVLPDLASAIGEVTSLLDQLPENLPYSEQLTSVLHTLERVQGHLTGIGQTFVSGSNTSDRFSASEGDSVAMATGKGRLPVRRVDSPAPSSTETGRFSSEWVDSTIPPSAPADRFSGMQVDSLAPSQGSQEASIHQKSTHDLPKSAQTMRFPALQRDILAKRVDSDDELNANVNVITIIESITLNVNTVALFCCKALGEAPGKRGIYSKLFREVDFQASAITAALVYTLVHREDGTIRKPAAVFYQRCKDYHQSGVPEEAAALVERYGQLSYPQFLDALRRKAPPAVQSGSPTLVSPMQREGPAHQTPASLLPLSRVRPSLIARIPLNKAGGMQREDAQRLRARIAGDPRWGLCRLGVVVLADGTYAVLIDNTVTEIVHQVVIYSAHEWQIRSAHLTSGHELFVPAGQAKPHSAS